MKPFGRNWWVILAMVQALMLTPGMGGTIFGVMFIACDLVVTYQLRHANTAKNGR